MSLGVAPLMQRIHSWLRPKYSAIAVGQAQAIAFDKSKDKDQRASAMWYLANAPHDLVLYDGVVFTAILEVFVDKEDDKSLRQTAASILAMLHNRIRRDHCGSQYGIYAANRDLRPAFIKLMLDFLEGDKHSWHIATLAMGDNRFEDEDSPLYREIMTDIGNAIRKKSNREDARCQIMTWSRERLATQDYQYIEFTNATIQIAEDITELSSVRVAAVRTLDPAKHRDHLWELRKDGDTDVRRAAIEAINHEALSK